MQCIFTVFHLEFIICHEGQKVNSLTWKKHGNSFMALGITSRLIVPKSISVGLSSPLNLNTKSPIIHWFLWPNCLTSSVSKSKIPTELFFLFSRHNYFYILFLLPSALLTSHSRPLSLLWLFSSPVLLMSSWLPRSSWSGHQIASWPLFHSLWPDQSRSIDFYCCGTVNIS